jgi:hypothetical protein
MFGQNDLILSCSYCRTKLTEDQMFAFRDWVGCESCLRAYYRNLPGPAIEEKLQSRRRAVVAWLAANRKSLKRRTD